MNGKPQQNLANLALKASPYKLNDSLIEKICATLRSTPGAPIEAIAATHYISRESLRLWTNQGQADVEAGLHDTIHAQFFLKTEAAKHDGHIELTKELRPINPLAILARRFSEFWPSERQLLELSGPNGQPLPAPVININVANFSGNSPFPFKDESGINPEVRAPDKLSDLETEIARAEAERAEPEPVVAPNTVPGRLGQMKR